LRTGLAHRGPIPGGRAAYRARELALSLRRAPHRLAEPKLRPLPSLQNGSRSVEQQREAEHLAAGETRVLEQDARERQYGPHPAGWIELQDGTCRAVALKQKAGGRVEDEIVLKLEATCAPAEVDVSNARSCVRAPVLRSRRVGDDPQWPER
jgi:hypothetical protein